MRHKDIQKNKFVFKRNMRMMGALLAYELSKSLSYKEATVETPLGTAPVDLLQDLPVLITILRAGLPLLEGFQEVFPGAESGYLGAYRLENGSHPDVELHYRALPELNGKVVLLVDPMLATGQSIEKGIHEIMMAGKPAHTIIASVVAAPEGVRYLEDNLTIPFDLWLGAMDEKLNEHAYIVPGLGDAGDLSFGVKY